MKRFIVGVYTLTACLAIGLAVYLFIQRADTTPPPSAAKTHALPPEYKLGTFYAKEAAGSQAIMEMTDFLRHQPGVAYVRVENGDFIIIKFDKNRFNWRAAWRTIRLKGWAKFRDTDLLVKDVY